MFRSRPRGGLAGLPSEGVGTAGWARPELDAAVASVGMQVNRDNVLRARGILLAEADRLDAEMVYLGSRMPPLANCGDDPVSRDATPAFTQRIGALLDHCLQYNRDLREAAYALDATARSYGLTDEEIAASFRAGG